MPQLVWTTDPHLNHAPLDAWQRWIDAVVAQQADGLLITGDISEGDDVPFQLARLADAIHLPVYFVLGNHDFYQSSIAETRRQIVDLCREYPLLHYLTDSGPIEMLPGVVMLGEDGWGDAGEGQFETSTIRLNDFELIDDFRQSDPSVWKQRLVAEGQQSADRLRAKLEQLAPDTRQLLIITHVPPFREACWYEGRTTDDNWAPFFVCRSVGDCLRAASRSRPDCQFTVLCGHTHHGGIAQLEPNLRVHTGAAQYGQPRIQGLVEVTADGLEVVT